MNPELPGTYINLLVETIKRWGVSGEQLLDGSGITLDQLEKPYWYVEFNTLNQLIERAIELCKEPALGGYLALNMTASCYGSVGIAAMVSPNLREALKILEQFIGSRCKVFKPELKQENNDAYWSIHQPVNAFQLSPNANIFLLIGFVQIAKKLTGLSHLGKVELQMPEPIGFDQISHQLAVTCLFNQKRNRWIFPKEYLAQPVLTADPMLAPLLNAQCKRDIEKLNLKSGWKGQVKQVAEKLLLNGNIDALKVGQVAHIMSMSERTLQRYLALDHTSFTLLVDSLKKEHALKLLAQNNMSIEKVALMLGYAETSHFTRAFKRWMGMTPKYFQTQHKIADSN
ncbi:MULTISPECIES: AraC family transcriptional regulator [unclassified Acinetobacter]|uniref:AraC family transcriptional regulator n=1 Tax=unclassified Acinetobacter TaxID=196816 RepID=UPI0018EB623C|nr:MULTISPECIES: AraC family transcriptional regulator [unclassified Acinetobacter]MBJ6353777.1 AraC family transcriptional regulator ligand-binding domain-containing protein [Acinetobacter sp. c1]MBM0959396.1 AraC family transcriptional regulator ligand-binding domain-containing protein [Acinetobacter sp. C13]